MKEAMIERLVEAVKDIAGEGYEVKATVVKKNNEVELDAVNIRKAGENVVPTIYIQRELKLLETDKITVQEAAKHVLEVYEENKVSEQEILGYSVYRYNRETGTIEVAA